MSELNNTTPTEAQATETQETKTYTQEEVDDLLQRETDRRVSSALKKAEDKNKQKLNEAKKLAQMDATQKYEYELEQREAAILEKEKALALAENKNICSKILADKGISLALVDFVVDTDADNMNEKIKTLEKAFKASVKAEVEKRLGSDVPKKNLPTDATITKEQILKLDYSSMVNFKKEQPELWQELMK